MTRHLILFAVTFAIGTVIAVVLRTASHKPYDEHRGHPTPSAVTAAPVTPDNATDPRADHAAAAPATGAVNSLCAICGMPVNPALGTIEYKGKQIGFGCKICLPKFKADPEKYGEAALKNQVVE